MRVPLAVALLSAASCAGVSYVGDATPVGSYGPENPGLDRALRHVARAESKGVRVFVGQLPDGIVSKGQALAVADPVRYQLVGHVSAVANDTGEAFFWFYDYPPEQAWLKAYCYPQVVLIWLTLFNWLALPFYYPCAFFEGNSPSAIADEKHRLLQTLRERAFALGGNVLVVTRLGSSDLVGPETNERPEGDSNLIMGGGEGFVFLDRFAARR